MSLDFSVTKVKDFENITTAAHEVDGKPQWHSVTQALVWFSIPCGFQQITEKNFDMVWRRVNLWQHVTGGAIYFRGKDLMLSEEDVAMHIGLSTNASVKTDAEFLGSITRYMADYKSKHESAMELLGWKGHPAKEVTE